jgi:hypothetical protein
LVGVDVEDVADHDAQPQLEESDGEPQLDGEDAGEDYGGSEYGGELNWLHG